MDQVLKDTVKKLEEGGFTFDAPFTPVKVLNDELLMALGRDGMDNKVSLLFNPQKKLLTIFNLWGTVDLTKPQGPTKTPNHLQ